MSEQKPDSEKSNLSNKRKGQKAMRGKPLFYDEQKKKRNFNLTDTSWNFIGTLASAIGLSRSEWLERHIRAIRGEQSNSHVTRDKK